MFKTTYHPAGIAFNHEDLPHIESIHTSAQTYTLMKNPTDMAKEITALDVALTEEISELEAAKIRTFDTTYPREIAMFDTALTRKDASFLFEDKYTSLFGMLQQIEFNREEDAYVDAVDRHEDFSVVYSPVICDIKMLEKLRDNNRMLMKTESDSHDIKTNGVSLTQSVDKNKEPLNVKVKSEPAGYAINIKQEPEETDDITEGTAAEKIVTEKPEETQAVVENLTRCKIETVYSTEDHTKTLGEIVSSLKENQQIDKNPSNNLNEAIVTNKNTKNDGSEIKIGILDKLIKKVKNEPLKFKIEDPQIAKQIANTEESTLDKHVISPTNKTIFDNTDITATTLNVVDNIQTNSDKRLRESKKTTESPKEDSPIPKNQLCDESAIKTQVKPKSSDSEPITHRRSSEITSDDLAENDTLPTQEMTPIKQERVLHDTFVRGLFNPTESFKSFINYNKDELPRGIRTPKMENRRYHSWKYSDERRRSHSPPNVPRRTGHYHNDERQHPYRHYNDRTNHHRHQPRDYSWNRNRDYKSDIKKGVFHNDTNFSYYQKQYQRKWESRKSKTRVSREYRHEKNNIRELSGKNEEKKAKQCEHSLMLCHDGKYYSNEANPAAEKKINTTLPEVSESNPDKLDLNVEKTTNKNLRNVSGTSFKKREDLADKILNSKQKDRGMEIHSNSKNRKTSKNNLTTEKLKVSKSKKKKKKEKSFERKSSTLKVDIYKGIALFFG